jgi:hypothetical protein
MKTIKSVAITTIFALALSASANASEIECTVVAGTVKAIAATRLESENEAVKEQALEYLSRRVGSDNLKAAVYIWKRASDASINEASSDDIETLCYALFGTGA